MTESVKTGLICTKYTYSFYHIYLFFCLGYTISVSFIEFLRKFCVYDEIFDKVLCYEKELLNLKGSKLGQILRADKTGFRRLVTYCDNRYNLPYRDNDMSFSCIDISPHSNLTNL